MLFWFWSKQSSTVTCEHLNPRRHLNIITYTVLQLCDLTYKWFRINRKTTKLMSWLMNTCFTFLLSFLTTIAPSLWMQCYKYFIASQLQASLHGRSCGTRYIWMYGALTRRGLAITYHNGTYPCLLHTFPIHFNLFSDDVNAAHWNKDTSFNTIPQSNVKQTAEYTHPYLFSTLSLRQYESIQQQRNLVTTVIVIAIMQTNIL